MNDAKVLIFAVLFCLGFLVGQGEARLCLVEGRDSVIYEAGDFIPAGAEIINDLLLQADVHNSPFKYITHAYIK
ncbi:MAG: hypothetical protein CVV44_20140 [Spirochaetae bacterium HGW-Spirochaetae-1]|nr:MAG: hypothetical protein CVV44_20140 [Spirochaetae bacterium HGW-Spirochaetae-1]